MWTVDVRDYVGMSLLITAIATLVTALATAGLAFWNNFKLKAVHDNVHKIELATNSMKDQLVNATREAATAGGVAIGRAEVKAEQSLIEQGRLMLIPTMPSSLVAISETTTIDKHE